MAICLICMKERKNGKGAGKYCPECTSEIDRRHSTIWAKTKGEIYTMVVRQMIMESAAKSEEQNGHNAQHQQVDNAMV